MKIIRPLALTATAVIALAACGGDDDGGDDDDATTTTAATSELTAPAAPTAPPDATPAPIETAAPSDTASSDTATASAEGFVFAGVDYTVTLPAEPQTTTQEAPTATPGETVEVVIHSLLDDQTQYAVSEIDVPEGVPYGLDAGVDGAVQEISGSLLSSEEIELDGVPGREFVATFSLNGVDGTYVSRVYSDQARVWQLAVAAPRALDATDATVVAFFDSFEFTEAGG